MIRSDKCIICEGQCRFLDATQQIIKDENFLSEWKSSYRSTSPEEVLLFLDRWATKARNILGLESIDEITLGDLKTCLFINAIENWPGSSISSTLRTDLISKVHETLDFFVKTSKLIEIDLNDSNFNGILQRLNHLSSLVKETDINFQRHQEKVDNLFIKTSELLREAGADQEIFLKLNEQFSNLLKDSKRSMDVATHFLKQGQLYYKSNKLQEAIKSFMEAKKSFQILNMEIDAQKCEKIIQKLEKMMKE